MNIGGKALQKNGSGIILKNYGLGNESIENKVIFIYPEQGHGDFIHCFRYIALLKDLHPKKIILEVTEPFYNIITSQDLEIEVIGPNVNPLNLIFIPLL
jgi:hypothetical protein